MRKLYCNVYALLLEEPSITTEQKTINTSKEAQNWEKLKAKSSVNFVELRFGCISYVQLFFCIIFSLLFIILKGSGIVKNKSKFVIYDIFDVFEKVIPNT